jgi:hypothetical protein
VVQLSKLFAVLLWVGVVAFWVGVFLFVLIPRFMEHAGAGMGAYVIPGLFLLFVCICISYLIVREAC